MESQPIIQVVGLRKLFPVRAGLSIFDRKYIHAVEDVSLQIRRGEILGIVGESGSGKTTLGRILVWLATPTAGSVYFDGSKVTGRGQQFKDFRKKAQMIFQDPYGSLDPRLTILKTVSEPLSIQRIGTRNEKLKLVMEILEQVELKPAEEFLRRYPRELSGGQRQRVAIARALVLRPEFLVADEPVSMLDVSTMAEILNVMLKLKDEFGVTYLFITHDLSVARYMCNSIAVMYQGRIVERAPTETIVQNPKHPYTKLLISAVPLPDPTQKRQRIRGRPDQTTDNIESSVGCVFFPRCSYAVEQCKGSEPQLEKLEDDHYVACYVSH